MKLETLSLLELVFLLWMPSLSCTFAHLDLHWLLQVHSSLSATQKSRKRWLSQVIFKMNKTWTGTNFLHVLLVYWSCILCKCKCSALLLLKKPKFWILKYCGPQKFQIRELPVFVFAYQYFPYYSTSSDILFKSILGESVLGRVSLSI